MSNNNTKSYNPKSHIPAVYIPCWLSQIPSSQLSLQAKMLYGRLAQWSNNNGIVYRSVNQLSKEIGVPPKTVERFLKELRDVKLIETYREKAGGVNHYRFLDNKWIYEPLTENLEYLHFSSETDPPPKKGSTPPSNLRVPPLKNEGTYKYKEIKNKNNKNTTTTLAREEKKKSPPSSSVITPEIDKKLLALRDEYIYKRQNRKHDPKTDRSDEEFLRQCSHHLDNGDKQKYNLVRRLKGLETIIKSGFFETPAGYREKKIVKSTLTPEENALFAKYQHGLRMSELGQSMSLWVTDKEMIEVNKIIEKIKSTEQAKPLKLKDILAKGIPG